jgi:hypothetical protein
MEPQVRADPQVFADPPEGLEDHRGAGGVVRCDLVGPDAGTFVVVERAEQEAAVGGVVLGLVELRKGRHDGQAVAGAVGGGEVPVDGIAPAVLEVEAIAVILVDDGLHGAGAGDGGHQRRCGHGVVVGPAPDDRHEVGVGVPGGQAALERGPVQVLPAGQ